MTTEIRDVRPGHHPEDVLDAGRGAVTLLGHLDSSSIDVARGVPFVALRFTVPVSSRAGEASAAVEVAKAVWSALDGVAVIGGGRLHRRVKGQWVPVGP